MYRKYADLRLRPLLESIQTEAVAGFPRERLFLDSVEQEIATAQVRDHAASHRLVQIFRGSLGSACLRRIAMHDPALTRP